MAKIDSYIDKEVRKGFSYDDIRIKLKKAGYSKNAINDGVRAHSLRARGAGNIVSLHTTTIVFLVVVLLVLIFAVFLLSKIPFGKFKESGEFFAEKLSIPSEFQDAMEVCYGQPDCDICLLKLAKEYDSFAPCDSILNAFLRDSCVNADWRLDDCTFEAIVGEDADNCIFRLDMKEDFGIDVDEYCDLSTMTAGQCRVEIAIESENVSVCEWELACIYAVPIIKNDPKLCFDSPGCITNYAREMNDTSVCYLITSPDYLPGDSNFGSLRCVEEVGSSSEHVSYFNDNYRKLSSDKIDVREFVFLHSIILSQRMEPDSCSGLEGSYGGIAFSDYCYWLKSYANIAYCDYVSDSRLKSCCLNELHKGPSDDEERGWAYLKCGLSDEAFAELSG